MDTKPHDFMDTESHDFVHSYQHPPTPSGE